MEWQYSYPSNEAMHMATKVRFKITYARGSSGVSIVPLGATEKLPAAEQSRLIEALRQHVAEEALRHELQTLIGQKCGGDLASAARAISLVSGKTVTTRTIQSWLIEPGRPSSRNCPEWAVAALREKEASRLTAARPERKPFHEDPYAEVNDVRDRKSVLRATERLEEEERRRVSWKKVAAAAFPASIADLETRLLRRINVLEDREHAFYEALKAADSFDDFRRRALDMREATSLINLEVEEARRYIENNAEQEEKQ